MTKPEVKPIRGQILQAAMDATLGSRNKSYGAPTPNLQLANELIATVHPFLKDKYSPAHNQAIYLALHKLARIACGAVGHTDNYVDAAAYFAIAAECEDLSSNVTNTESNYHTTGSDLVEEFWKGGNGFKDSLQSVINADTEEMLEDIARQNTEASQAEIKPSERFDHYGESISVLRHKCSRVIKVGDTFYSNRSDDAENRRVWAIIKMVSPTRYQVECVDSKDLDDVGVIACRNEDDINAFCGEDGSSSLKCIHCPEDTAPNKDVCVKCVMELGQ